MFIVLFDDLEYIPKNIKSNYSVFPNVLIMVSFSLYSNLWLSPLFESSEMLAPSIPK